MKVTSDLTFSVDTPDRGLVTGTVRSEGSHVTIETGNPAAVMENLLTQLPATGKLTRLAGDQLHHEGVQVSLVGPKGLVASVGAGIRSPVGRLLAGSWRVRLGRPAAVAPLAWASVKARLRAAPARRWGDPARSAAPDHPNVTET